LPLISASRGDISQGLMTRAIWKRPCINLFITYFARANNMLLPFTRGQITCYKLVLLWAQLTKIYPPLPTSVQPISITKTLLIVSTKNERDPFKTFWETLLKLSYIFCQSK
jgi:hypothetical protein